VLRLFCHVADMHGVEFAAADVKRLAVLVGSIRRRVTLGKPAIQNGYQFQEVDKVLDKVPRCIPTKPCLNW
jgi:hypothetical protein